MEPHHRHAADALRASLERGEHDREAFRATLLAVPPLDRDAWLDVVLGLGELPDDGPALPRDGVAYLPCPVDDLLRVVDHTPVREGDVFVDVGAGVGRATALVHLLTGASTVGLEVQPHLVAAARAHAARLHLARMRFLEGDAAALTASLDGGSVFFLYCPFSGERLATLLDALEPRARAQAFSVCCVDLPLPARPWLVLTASPRDGLDVYRSSTSPSPRA